jgi:predicted nucleic acid-binding protein
LSAVIDTNVLVFDTFEDSEFHKEAASGLDSLQEWHIPSMVFHELVWFFKGRAIQVSRVNTKVEEYLRNEKTKFSPCTADDLRFAASHLRDYHEYNDLVILSVAKRLGTSLFTFDDGLKKSARRNAVNLLEL